ncbi:Sodium/calcium exchanger protein-domain-containing protein [Trametes maxima]|nr:Sodium/calcium exchanger protein-domain-containing protein [Trametes maxima]
MPSAAAESSADAAPQTSAVQRHPTFDVPGESNTQRRSTANTNGAISRATSRSSQRPTSLLRSLTMPEKPVGRAPPILQQIRAIVVMSWLNVLLVCIPVSWALHFALPSSNSNDTLIFVFSFLAIIPLAKLLAFATDELSMRVGQTLAGLLNATLGNAVELIVAIIALVKCELQIVQSSLVGSILSNLLLVLGMCFFAGGTRFSEQGFGISVTQLNSSLLILSVIGLLIPAAFHFAADAQIPDNEEATDILSVSHGTAIILLFIYGSYLVFQLFSHKTLYDDAHPDVFKSTRYERREKKAENGAVIAQREANGSSSLTDQPLSLSPVASHEDPEANTVAEPEEVEEPQMSVPMTIGLLAVVTVLVAVTAEFLVDSINGLVDTGNINREFIGVILLPIVGNAAEHVTAVTVSVKDKLTLSLGVAVGSSIQIALFVIPFIVTLGWIMGKPLSMLFDPFESIVLFFSVLVVNYVVQDGKSNWLEGMILMCLYIILALTFWFYPGVTELGRQLMC